MFGFLLSVPLQSTILYCASVFFAYGGNFNLWGKSNKEVSKLYETMITPAGWAFSIWGLIYLGEFLGIIYLWNCNRFELTELFFSGGPRYIALAFLYQILWCVIFAKEFLIYATILLGYLSWELLCGLNVFSSYEDRKSVV